MGPRISATNLGRQAEMKSMASGLSAHNSSLAEPWQSQSVAPRRHMSMQSLGCRSSAAASLLATTAG
jgi:hypothetical protein